MKAVGRNLIIEKKKEGTTKTKGGLLLAETEEGRHVSTESHRAIGLRIDPARRMQDASHAPSSSSKKRPSSTYVGACILTHFHGKSRTRYTK